MSKSKEKLVSKKKGQIKKNIDSKTLSEITDKLLDNLNERPRGILIRRFGLDGSKPEVLDKIGKEFDITRERVRQIENDSFKKLQLLEKDGVFSTLIDRAIDFIGVSGGFCEKRFLKEKLKKNLSQDNRNQLMFILNSSKRLKFKKGNLNLSGFWCAKKNSFGSEVLQAHNFIVKSIKKGKDPYTIEDIAKIVSESEWKDFFDGSQGKKRLEMILKMSRLINQNILGEWGMKNWKLISQRGARERAYLALRKHNEPLHFRDITKLINKYWSEKKSLPQTVHNELIKDSRFVLTGRGMYGLRGWGFTEGTVKEIILSFLSDRNGSAFREEIIEYVLSRKQVKRTTVLVTLADKNIFKREEDGLFSLIIKDY